MGTARSLWSCIITLKKKNKESVYSSPYMCVKTVQTIRKRKKKDQ